MWASEAPCSSISKNQMKSLKPGHHIAKIMLFRTHHLWNSTTELILIYSYHRHLAIGLNICFIYYSFLIVILFMFSKSVHLALLRITFMCLVTQFCIFCLFAFLSECCRSFSLYIACFGPHNEAKLILGMHSAKK